jgi:hypothetical protein
MKRLVSITCLLSLIVCFLGLSLGGQQNSVETNTSKTLHASDFGLGQIKDAAVAINAMYAAAGDHSVLVIDPGVYDMFTPIKMIGNKRLTIIADQAVLSDKSDADIGFTFGAAPDGITNLGRCKIVGLTLGRFGPRTGIGLQIQNCSISVVRDCTIIGYGTAIRQWADAEHYCYFNILDNLSTYSCRNQIKLDGVAGNATSHQSRTMKIINFDTSAAGTNAGDTVFDFGIGAANLVIGASVQTDTQGLVLESDNCGGNYMQLEYIEGSKGDMSVNWGPNSQLNTLLVDERRLNVNDQGHGNVQRYPNATIESK